MEITAEIVAHVANLARLELTEAEAQKMQAELSGIIHFIEQLDEMDVSGVNAELDFGYAPTLRDDTAQKRFERETLLANAPEAEDGAFRVPQILDASATGE
ncbi:MAG: Asp-tRNA(Asn)/Glu-tRNA(Gln) amidotransferase subunit GatC [Vampirovibrionales bacterium]|nr:Asp-tRNA(Asn)/Glu-tRNA(Gln) amidotransferase subunit GatC [Vampirovibrionales bacterium]